MTLCKCGCCKEIIMKPYHKYYGIPKYIYGHNLIGKYPLNKNPYPPIFDLCHCGCGQIVYGGRRFIRGHNNKGIPKTNEWKNKIGDGNRGKIRSKEAIKRLSDSHRGILIGDNNPMRNPEIAKKNGLAKVGRPRSEETKKKLSVSHEGEKSYLWKGGISFEPYCPKFNNRKKEEIRNKYGRRCYICNRNEKDNITKTNKLRKLSIHHIDEDKEQGCNGKSWKLIPLCLKCHGKEHKKNKYIEWKL